MSTDSSYADAFRLAWILMVLDKAFSVSYRARLPRDSFQGYRVFIQFWRTSDSNADINPCQETRYTLVSKPIASR